MLWFEPIMTVLKGVGIILVTTNFLLNLKEIGQKVLYYIAYYLV